MITLPTDLHPRVHKSDQFYRGVVELLKTPASWTLEGTKLVHQNGLWLEYCQHGVQYGDGDVLLGFLAHSNDLTDSMRDVVEGFSAQERDRLMLKIKLLVGERPQEDEDDDEGWNSFML